VQIRFDDLKASDLRDANGVTAINTTTKNQLKHDLYIDAPDLSRPGEQLDLWLRPEGDIEYNAVIARFKTETGRRPSCLGPEPTLNEE